VQTTGHLVATAAELPAGVQHGQRQGDGRDLLGRVFLDGDAASVVDHLDAVVGQQPDLDGVAVAGQRLVDGVVDDLGHQVVQAALTGRTDVHARALADGLESFQHRDRLRVVRGGSGIRGWKGVRSGAGIVAVARRGGDRVARGQVGVPSRGMVLVGQLGELVSHRLWTPVTQAPPST